jgi:hypothetical protein
MWPAFPASDYYGSSVPAHNGRSTPKPAGVLHAGSRARVPAFQPTTHGPCRRLALPLGARAGEVDEHLPPRRRIDVTRPMELAGPAWHHAPRCPAWGCRTFKYRGFRHELRCLAIGPSVARRPTDRSSPGSSDRSAVLTRASDHAASFAVPFRPFSSYGGAPPSSTGHQSVARPRLLGLLCALRGLSQRTTPVAPTVLSLVGQPEVLRGSHRCG